MCCGRSMAPKEMHQAQIPATLIISRVHGQSDDEVSCLVVVLSGRGEVSRLA